METSSKSQAKRRPKTTKSKKELVLRAHQMTKVVSIVPLNSSSRRKLSTASSFEEKQPDTCKNSKANNGYVTGFRLVDLEILIRSLGKGHS